MRRLLVIFTLAIAGLAVTADQASAGPLLRRFLGTERSTSVSRTRTYSFGGGCANGSCARSSSTTASASSSVAKPVAQPTPKSKDAPKKQ